VHEIWIDRLVWPDLANEWCTIGVLKEDTLGDTLVIGLITFIRSSTDTSINNGDEFHVHAVELVDVAREVVESTWLTFSVELIHSEVLIVLHVVDVDPLGVKGDAVVDVALG